MTNAEVLALYQNMDQLLTEQERAERAYQKASQAERNASYNLRKAREVMMVVDGVAVKEGSHFKGTVYEAVGDDIDREAHIEKESWGSGWELVVKGGGYRPRKRFEFKGLEDAKQAALAWVAKGLTPDDQSSPVTYDELEALTAAAPTTELKSAVRRLKNRFFPYYD